MFVLMSIDTQKSQLLVMGEGQIYCFRAPNVTLHVDSLVMYLVYWFVMPDIYQFQYGFLPSLE